MSCKNIISGLKREFKNTCLYDYRLLSSLIKIAKALLKSPHKSFSAACGESLRHNGTRIFSSKKMNPEDILSGHYDATAKRCKNESTLLLVQDTTSFNYSGLDATEGLGPISSSTQSKGLLMHTLVAMCTSGLMLGILDMFFWARNPEERGKKHQRKDKPIEEKESNKWLQSVQKALMRLKTNFKKIYIISDRESDIFEYFIMQLPENVFLLLRAIQARRVELDLDCGNWRGGFYDLLNILKANHIKSILIEKNKKQYRVDLAVSYATIKIHPPKYLQTQHAAVEMTIINAKEVSRYQIDNAGKSIKELTKEADKIDWILLCSQTGLSDEEASQMIDFYSQRWKIERFHYTLKTGVFNVEKLQFKDAHTLENALSLYSALAWRVLYTTYYGRIEPENKADKIIDKVEKEILEKFTKKKIETSEQALFAIGTLGGFLGGKGQYKYPGVKLLWIGIAQLEAMKIGWLLAKGML